MIVGERYLPFDAQRELFVAVIREARSLGANVIFSTVLGAGIAALYDAYTAEKLDPEKTPIASLTTNEVHIQEAWMEPLPGHIVSAPYFEAIRSERNAGFVSRYWFTMSTTSVKKRSPWQLAE